MALPESNVPINRDQRRILIVDDEPYNILALKIMLKSICSEEFELMLESILDQAPNGEVAYDMVKLNKYGLIFMDC